MLDQEPWRRWSHAIKRYLLSLWLKYLLTEKRVGLGVASRDHAMFSKTVILFLLVRFAASENEDLEFTYNGFFESAMHLYGAADMTSDGLLKLTNIQSTSDRQVGHGFLSFPVAFKSQSQGNNTVSSFSTTFVFGIIPFDGMSGQGLAFVITRANGIAAGLPSQYLGISNPYSNGNSSNHLLAIELDTVLNPEFADINDNHVGIDINSLISINSQPAGYFSDRYDGVHSLIRLKSGKPLQAWIEYDGERKQLDVTLAPARMPKPRRPLLSSAIDLSEIFVDPMYMGFSAATGSLRATHQVYGWSFKLNGPAQALNFSDLSLSHPKKRSRIFTIWIPLLAAVFALGTVSGTILIVRSKIKFAEIYEEWELAYGAQRFLYKDLYMAAKGFNEKGLLGFGGFGMVYKGVLQKSMIEVAVKKISHNSQQGMKEFVAEIASIGRIRHPSLVRLLGYCRRKGELLLVYDFLCKGSLDKYLFDSPRTILTWSQRFKILKDVASGLLFLHEEWTQVVLHRDIKASNVLLDGDYNGKLGDFGLCRLHDHGSDPHTSRLVGTIGYMAPELSQTGKSTKSTDVYAFGVFLLEVVCGRRPFEPRVSSPDKMFLVDWVLGCLGRGWILEAVDWKLGTGCSVKEMELVLKLGLLCTQRSEVARPNMKQVIQILEGAAPLPEAAMEGLVAGALTGEGQREGINPLLCSCPPSLESVSILFKGR